MQTCGRLSEGSKRATNFYELEAQVKGASSLEESLVSLPWTFLHAVSLQATSEKAVWLSGPCKIQLPIALKQLQSHILTAGQVWFSSLHYPFCARLQAPCLVHAWQGMWSKNLSILTDVHAGTAAERGAPGR